jgi:hypothetical protein
VFEPAIGDLDGTGLLSALGLEAVVFGFDVRVERRVGKVAFAATAYVVATVFVFARTARGTLGVLWMLELVLGHGIKLEFVIIIVIIIIEIDWVIIIIIILYCYCQINCY